MSNKIREVIAFEDHFVKFLKTQDIKTQNKIFKVIEAVETLQRVPSNYLKAIKNVQGL